MVSWEMVEWFDGWMILSTLNARVPVDIAGVRHYNL